MLFSALAAIAGGSYAHLLLFAVLLLVVMKCFRRGLHGLVQDLIRPNGLLTRVPPITVVQASGEPSRGAETGAS